MAAHLHCFTHHRVSCATLLSLIALALTAAAFDVAADGWGFNLERPSAQTAPYPGQEVTYTVELINNFTDTRALDFSVLWKKPDGDALAVSTHEVELAPGASQSFPQTVTLAGSGQYRIIVYDTVEGPDLTNALGSWTFEVAKVYPSGASDAINTLQITVTHAPEFPRAEVRHQGSPEHRDLITLTIAMENVSDFKIFPAGPIQVKVTNPDATTSNHLAMSYEFSLPEIVPGQAHTDTHTFRLDLPGTNTVAIRSNAYGQLAAHTIQTVPYVTTSLTNPTVTPVQGPPGTQFTVDVTYLSWDNVAPSAVKVAVAALPGQMFTMQKKTPSDSSYGDGCVYTCVFPATLPAAEHSVCFYAYQRGQEVFNTGMVPGPKVTDNVVPTIAGGGQQQPDMIVRRSGEVTLSGTASDPEGPIDKVEWRVAGGAWQETTGRENWSFNYDSGAQDQDFITKDFEVRAFDMAGNVTHSSDYWRQRVVWERRHPKIIDTFVTDMAQGIPSDSPPSVQAAKPGNNGNPKMNETYIIAFKVTNPNTTDAYTFDFCWKETAVTYEPAHPPWGLGMDPPGYCTGGPVTIGRGETKWVYTYWNHHWSWIKEKGVYDILCDMIFAYIPVAGELYSGLTALDTICTGGFAVKETKWTTRRAEGMPESVCGGDPIVSATIEVSTEKRLWLVDSVAAGLAAHLSTTAGMALGWCPAGWALLITEGVLIGTSHACYYTAWDPSPDFQKRASIVPIELEVPEEFRDDPEVKNAETACRFAENIIAMKEAYIRGLGAEEKGKIDLARQHYEDAANYVKQAGVHAKSIERQLNAAAKTIETATEEQRKLVDDFARSGELPESEQAFLKQSFGVDQKAISSWGDFQSRVVPKVMENPQSGVSAIKLFIKTLPQIEKELRNRTSKLKG